MYSTVIGLIDIKLKRPLELYDLPGLAANSFQ